ncbi:hypothetical protein QTG54_004338 [Skeletonema marinoi]|uniref:Glutaredoxin domain-containing protein n=1 Tax=Skeletonema marinoi TaxID=267567 RepID=A0AAD9DF88_9STRA|nr:hypothetical protein QTG54_004338 [Skeletonema marinoi]|mmetsp:Transcript_4937/g.10334  ORF Transcript_4937/g.10334 Transcript_4937/m.10334 type:complete len:176 (+) Transcript_4937:135-662(+)
MMNNQPPPSSLRQHLSNNNRNQKAATTPNRSRVSSRKAALVGRYRNYRNAQIGLVKEQKKLICLVSQGCHDRAQETNQSVALRWFNSKQIPYTTVDGMDPNQRQKRNELFDISGLRGNYPQFFFEYQNGTIQYLGNFSTLERLNESSNLPLEVLSRHVEIETFDKIFGSVVASFR